MKFSYAPLFWLSVLSLLIFSACNNKRFLKVHAEKINERKHKKIYDERLVKQHKIQFEKQNYVLQEDPDNLYYELESIIKQQPNMHILSARVRLWFYNVSASKRIVYKYDKKRGDYYADTLLRKSFYEPVNDSLTYKYKWNKSRRAYDVDTLAKRKRGFLGWLGSKVGEPPVIYDSTLTTRTVKEMQRYLVKKGYAKAEVSSETKFKGQNVYTTYSVKTNMPILLDSLLIQAPDKKIEAYLLKNKKSSLLRPGVVISEQLLNNEKKRICIALRNIGYQDFIPEDVEIIGDTINARKFTKGKKKYFGSWEQGEPRANLMVIVKPYSDQQVEYPLYTIRNVYITPKEDDFRKKKPHRRRVIKADTTFIVMRQFKRNKEKRIALTERDSIRPTDRFLHMILQKRKTKTYVKSKVLSSAVTLYNNNRYSFEDELETRRRIANLNLFNYQKVIAKKVENPQLDSTQRQVDMFVRTRMYAKQELGTDIEFNTDNSNLGWAIYLNYKNKNLFKGGEIFNVKLQGGVNFKLARDSVDLANSTNITNLERFAQYVNLLDLTADVGLDFPKYMGFPFIERALKMENARTKASIGYNYLQQSYDFRISSFYAKMGYTWKRKREHQFIWNPVLLNFTLRPVLRQGFAELLEENNVALLRSLEAEYLIPSMDFTYYYISKPNGYGTNLYAKFYFETAGNLFKGIDQIFKPNEVFRPFSVDYSQYIRFDVDLRYSWEINRRNALVTRLLVGAVIPYGNSSNGEIPFARRFSLGGPSSMRAWQIRHLGPGRKKSIAGAEFQLGDVRMEYNLEYRLKFNSWIGTALFFDIGNVWLISTPETENVKVPNKRVETGKFSKDFYKELAIGTGLGLRLDFSFFVIRLDWGLQLRDPSGYGLRNDGQIQYWNIKSSGFPLQIKDRNQWVLGIGYPF